jgi:hypothetical protein
LGSGFGRRGLRSHDLLRPADLDAVPLQREIHSPVELATDRVLLQRQRDDPYL